MSVPIKSDKHALDALFRPHDFLRYLEKIGLHLSHRPPPAAVILCYQKSLFDYAVTAFPTERARGYFGQWIHYIELEHTESSASPRLAIASNFGIGAPAAAVMLEELIAWGVKDFISMGTAGSLTKDIPPGSLVLCDRAFRDEGTSHHYLPHHIPAEPDACLTARLQASLDACGLPYRKGPAWTTDAIYRETPEEVRHFQDMGALVVEMEAAALFSVARYRGVRIAACFSVSDTLAYLEWKPEFHADTTRESLELLFRVAVSALSSALGEDGCAPTRSL
ncbi:MAG: nucleoside phosphorylase [Rectinema sp.]|nr:nucleoside phosphorylase [Rectinema sp.]